MSTLLKKAISLLIGLVLLVGPVVAEETKSIADVFYFLGVGGEWRDNRAGSLHQTFSVRLQNQAEDAYQTMASQSPFGTADQPGRKKFIIAHSQGGLRALALAHLAKERGTAGDLAGIVVINSPVKGFSPLRSGLDPLRNKVNHLTRKVGGFAGALVNVGFGWGGGWWNLVGDALGLPVAITPLLNWILGLVPAKTAGTEAYNFIQMIVKAPSGYEGTITDMSPTSTFVKTNIAPSYEKVPQGHWVKTQVQTGFDTRLGQPIYTTQLLYVQDPPTTQKITKLDPDTPVGFIKGNNPDVAAGIDKSLRNLSGISLDAALAGMGGIAMAVASVNALYAVQNSLWGIANCNPFTWPAAVWFFAQAAWCTYCSWVSVEVAYLTVQGPNGIMNEFLGTDNHDTFIPFADQEWDLADLGGRPLNVLQTNVFVEYETHAGIKTSPKAFGIGSAGLGDWVRRDRPPEPGKLPYSDLWTFLNSANIGQPSSYDPYTVAGQPNSEFPYADPTGIVRPADFPEVAN